MLINQLEQLFESFINLINSAIDEKSPYTGGHCQRVPVLTMMLAEAVNETREGPLADFHMTEKDRYELKIAGLLHDCGKVTTPVHVVDKATKLETIFDRIHLIDTRFEVLKRDAEIEALQERQLGARRAAAPSGCASWTTTARSCTPATSAASACATRTSSACGASPRYRWRDVAGHEANFLTEDEVKNLTIRAGTLTEDERKIINHHIVATIKMLEALPWPKHLTNVPEYAGGHHERMDGKGYPAGPDARADVGAGALHGHRRHLRGADRASDRPYKKGKTLSESLEILGRMKLNNHVDPDLFDVFVREQGLPALRRDVPRPGPDRRGRRVEDPRLPALRSDRIRQAWTILVSPSASEAHRM